MKDHISRKKRNTLGREKHSGIQVQFLGNIVSIEKLQIYFNNLLLKTKDGELIEEKNDVEAVSESNQLKEVLAYHTEAETRFEWLEAFSVGIHSFHKRQRCFYVVEKEKDIYFFRDFSITKCLKNLAKNWDDERVN